MARCELAERDEVYRIFVTDALCAITGAKNIRYADIISGMDSSSSDDRSAEEVISLIRSKLENV